eukprot:gene14011-10012_t
MESICDTFSAALERVPSDSSLQARLYRELEAHAVRINVLVDPIKVTIDGDVPDGCPLSSEIFLDRNVALHIEEHNAVVLKGGYTLTFTDRDEVVGVYVAHFEANPDASLSGLEKQKWFDSKSVEAFVSENELTNTIRDNSLEGLSTIDWRALFAAHLAPNGDRDGDGGEADGQQTVRIKELPACLTNDEQGCGFVVIDDVGICALSQHDGRIQGFLVVEEPQVLAEDDDGGEELAASAVLVDLEAAEATAATDAAASFTEETQETSEEDGATKAEDREGPKDAAESAPTTPTPLTATNIGHMTLAELEEYENAASLSLFQRQQVKKRKEELEKQRRLHEFLHIQSPEAMGEVVVEDLSSTSADNTPGTTGGGVKRGSIKDRFEEAKRKQQLQEEERLAKFKNDPRKKVTPQAGVKTIAGTYLPSADQDSPAPPPVDSPHVASGSGIKDRFEEAKRKQQLQEEERLAKFKNDPRKKITSQTAGGVKAIAGAYAASEHEFQSAPPPVESPQASTSGKSLGGARKSLRNMWEGVLETSKTTERDRFATTKQNTIAQFTMTKGTGLVKKRIDEWEELFVQIAASAEEMEEFLRAAQELSQHKEFSKKLSGLNLTDLITDFAESCLVPEEFVLGDTRIYNVRLFAPVTQSYLKRMMQESKTNHIALPCGVYGEQSAKPPIDVFAAAIRTNDDKMYIAVTVKAAAGKEDDPDVFGVRKMVVFGKDTKTQVMEKVLNIVVEYSTPRGTAPATKGGAHAASMDPSAGAALDDAADEATETTPSAAANGDDDGADGDDGDDGDVQPEGDLFAGEDAAANDATEEPPAAQEDAEAVAEEADAVEAEEPSAAEGEPIDAEPAEAAVEGDAGRHVAFDDVVVAAAEAPAEALGHEDDEEADEGDGTWTTAFTPMPMKNRDSRASTESDDLAHRLAVADEEQRTRSQSSVSKDATPIAATTVSVDTTPLAASAAPMRRPLIDDEDDNESNDADVEPDAAILDDESPTHFAKELCLAHVTIARTYLPAPIQRTEFSSSKHNQTKFSWPIEDEMDDQLPNAGHFVCNLNVRNVVTSTACANVFVLDNLGHGADAYDRHCDLFTGTLRHATTSTHYSVTPQGDLCLEWVRGPAASGWLLKWPMQSQRMGRRRWRFFVLRDNLLAYYANRPTSEEEIATTFSRNSLHLTETSNVAIGRKFLQRCLVVTTPLDTLWIRVRKDYQVEVNRWMREINQAIALQQRPKLVMSKTRVESRWYHESQSFFMVCADARGYRTAPPTDGGVSSASSSSSSSSGKARTADEALSETRYLKAALFCLRHDHAAGGEAGTDGDAATAAGASAAANSRRGSQSRRSITDTLLGTNKGPHKPLPYNSNSIGRIDPATVQYSIDIASSDGTRQQLPVVDERESPILSCALTVLKLCGDVVLLGGAQGYLGVGRFTTLRLGTYTANAEEATGRLSHSPQPSGNKARSAAQIPVGTRRVLMVHPFHAPSGADAAAYPHAADSVVTAMGMGSATSLVAVADSRGLVSLWEVPSHYPHRVRPRASSSAMPTASSPAPPAASSSSSSAAAAPATSERITKLVFAQHDHHLYVCTSQRLLLLTVDHNHQANRRLHHGHTQQRSLRASFRDWVVIDRALPDLEGVFDVVPPPAVSAQLFQEQLPVPPDVLEAMNATAAATAAGSDDAGDDDAGGNDAASASASAAATPKKPSLFSDEDGAEESLRTGRASAVLETADEKDWKLIVWRALEYEGAPVDEANGSSSSTLLRSLGVTLGASPSTAALYAKRRCTVSRVAWTLDMFRAALRSLRPIRAALTTTTTAPFTSAPATPAHNK